MEVPEEIEGARSFVVIKPLFHRKLDKVVNFSHYAWNESSDKDSSLGDRELACPNRRIDTLVIVFCSACTNLTGRGECAAQIAPSGVLLADMLFFTCPI